MSSVYVTLEIELDKNKKFDKEELNKLSDKLTYLSEVSMTNATLELEVVDSIKAYNKGCTYEL